MPVRQKKNAPSRDIEETANPVGVERGVGRRIADANESVEKKIRKPKPANTVAKRNKTATKRKKLGNSKSIPVFDFIIGVAKLSKLQNQHFDTTSIQLDGHPEIQFRLHMKLEGPRSVVPEFGNELAEIVARISQWAGGAEQAWSWCRTQHIPAFGDRTAEALVKSGQASTLLDYLDSIALGGFA